MKNILFILLLALIMICSLALHAQAATERSFAAGSLIIPRDSYYQPNGDGGILESFGLVYNLLKHVDPNTGYHDITLYWVLDPNKTSLTDCDLRIYDLSLKDNATLNEAVAFLYNHDGTQSDLTFQIGDSWKDIHYLGGPFIIDQSDAEKAKAVIDSSLCWQDVNVHVAGTQFSAMVLRELLGIPPRIALMNNKEERDGGNAAILESYLRLANISIDSYDILTPNDIRDGMLFIGDYQFLWTPHWEGYKEYDIDADTDGSTDVDEIVYQIGRFVKAGKGLLAECASIETFEHNKYGRFLTTKGIAHNGGENEVVVYKEVRSLNVQIGDFTFEPEGGHLHNWRPFQYDDPYELDDDLAPDAVPVGDPEVTEGNPSAYLDTVKRLTTDDEGWDYYVAGHAYGQDDFGYVIYLGGHKYASCGKTPEVDPMNEIHTLELEFKGEIPVDEEGEDVTMDVSYTFGSTTQTTSITIDLDGIPNTNKVGDPLEIDLSSAEVEDDKKKKIINIQFENIGASTLIVNSFTFTFNEAYMNCLKKIKDHKIDKDIYKNDNQAYSGVVLEAGDELKNDLIIEPSMSGTATVCEDNSECDVISIGGVQYVLLTLFDIKAQIHNNEYLLSAPIVSHPYLYQGSAEYPSYLGHFRRYNVTAETQTALWDTGGEGKIKDAKGGNSDTDARQVYTAAQIDSNSWSKIDFDPYNIDNLRNSLGCDPNDGDDTDEIKVINRLRGKTYDINTDTWIEWSNKLGAIMHSAPVIIESNATNSRLSERPEIAYVGDLYGMFHAIETATGSEKWAFIPRNLLGKLKYERTANEDLEFAAIDASPTAKDIYYDHDNDNQKEWRTILVCPEGDGGNYLFALDVTDPDNWFPMWEITDPNMGRAFRCAVNKVKVPIIEEGPYPITRYEAKWLVFVASGNPDIIDDRGGINIFAFDLKTGEKVWHFYQKYNNSINDIPGAVTLFDDDDDGFMDHVYVGDMNGRLWQINALDGTNPHGTETIQDASGDSMMVEIPLYNAGVNYPISVSPAIVRNRMNHTVLVFGTGGSDFASDEQSYGVYAVDATELASNKTYANGAGTLLWELNLGVGEKVWSSPTIVGGRVYVATSTGTMEHNPVRANLSGTGSLYAINLYDHTDYWSINDIGKTRGSIFVDRKHVYISTIDNQIIQVGSAVDFSDSGSSNVVLKAWRQVR